MLAFTRLFLAILLAIASAWRVVWVMQFFALSMTRRVSGWWKQVLADTLLPASARGSAEQALQRFNLYFTHQVAAYTLGGLALAAWSILLVAQGGGISKHYVLALLGLTVIVSFSSAVLFRAAGGELTRMGYESGLAIGSLSLLFAMAVMFEGMFDTTLVRVLVPVGAAILVLRDLVETFRQMQITAGLIPPAQRFARTD